MDQTHKESEGAENLTEKTPAEEYPAARLPVLM